jgi:chromosome segregation ATPase
MATSNERQRLRDAIESHRIAQQRLEEAEIAARKAQERWSEANERGGSISRQVESLEAGPADSTDDLIAGLAGGADLDLLDKPKNDIDELRKQLEAAEEESDRWLHAMKTAEGAIADRKQALDLAAHYVDGDARKVVAAEIDVAEMMREAEAARAAILDVQARLAAIASSMNHMNEKRRQLDNYVNDVGWLIDSPWRNRRAAQGVKDAFAKLKSDADATLKF